ncbi:ABC transporter ATP-binding protein [Cellulomonas endophytica]|uniref:ABC transporter ATP-binding protein n=1 Tax=Cellulomonas endophytica TaxID=2494735 RepID=UPI00101096C2|nr:ATP-binding cassette domain-containing protein [Cellulomonas endophytica]
MAAPEEFAITTRGLRKTYRTRRGRHVAVDDLSLRVPVGGVHGFLGPNGSGKTTTIRMLLGLVRADSGHMRLFGRTVPDALPEVIGRVGAIVESPTFFPAFSGRLNLELLAGAIGAPRTRVDEVLEEVGLRERGGDRYSGYSLGMKQRLAIAATLLKQPDLLIFDEPTNGLDPAGIHEIRGTMRALADGGRTVLVSSHILGEVEQVADTVSIVAHGRLLATGTLADVVGKRTAAARVVVPDTAAARAVLVAAGMTVEDDGDALRVLGEADPGRITWALAQGGIFLRELVPLRAGLEAAFLELTGEAPAPDGGGPPAASAATGTATATGTTGTGTPGVTV